MAEQRQIILDIQANTGKLNTRLEEIDKDLRDQTRALKKLNEEFKGKERLDDRYLKRQQEIKRTSQELRKERRQVVKQLELQNKATDAAAGSNERLRAQLSLLTKEYNKLGKEERETTEDGRAFQRQIRRISDELKRNEKAIGDNRRNVGNYGSALSGIGASILGGAGIGFAISSLTNLARRGAEVFIEFEQAIATLGAISGASAEELSVLEAEAKRLGETTQFTATQVAELQTNFARVGFDPSQIIAATEATLDLSIATGEDLAKSAEIVAGTLGGYQLSAEETARVTDVMAASFNSSALNLDKFSESTKLVGPIAANANISIEAVTGALGALADANISGSIAGTGLRRVISDLSNENSKLAKAVGFGVDSTEDFTKALEILSAKGIDNAKATELIGRNASSTLVSLIASKDGAIELGEALNNATGSAKETAAIVGDTLSQDLKKSQSALEGLAIRIGDLLVPAVRSLVQWFNIAVSNISSGVSDISNFFIDLYNESLAFRGIIQSIVVQVRLAVDFLKLAFNQLVDGFQVAGKLIKAVFTGNFSAIPDILGDAFSRAKENVTDFVVEVASDVKKGIDATINGTAERLSTEAPKKFEKAGKVAGASLAKGVADGFKTAAKKVESEIDKLRKKIGKISVSGVTNEFAFLSDDQKAQLVANRDRLKREKKIGQNILNARKELDAQLLQQAQRLANKQVNISREQTEEERRQAQERIRIANEEQQRRLAVLSGLSSGISAFQDLFRNLTAEEIQQAQESTAAQKVAGVAQASIDTYVAANRALASGLPIPANFIAAALSIATGLANVRQILGFAEGGKIPTSAKNLSRPRSNGDNVLITAKTGEVILNRRQQSQLGGDATFRRLGVPGFATGGMVGGANNLATLANRQAAEVEAQGANLLTQLRNMPAPVVTVKDISRVSNRVSVKQNTSRL